MLCLKNIDKNFFNVLIILCVLPKNLGRQLYLTNVKCRIIDPSFVEVTKCFTKHISRSITETTLNITLLQEIPTVAGKVGFYKKSNNQYNSYLYQGVLFDGCKFLAKRSNFPMVNYLYKVIEKYSNLNRTCPLKDYIMVDRLRIDMEKLQWIPLPSGEYSIFTHWFTSGKEKLQIDVYFTFNE